MPRDSTALFLSLRPRFAELLLNGSKSIELRRVRPDVAPGTSVLLYASSPIMKLVGRAEVAEVKVASAGQIWQEHAHETGISEREYTDYFEGLDHAVAIKLVNIRRLDRPRPLRELRASLAGFQPPQSYRYLNRSQVSALV